MKSNQKKTVKVISSVGEGDTLIGAFDRALFNAGVHNYNLIRLSSVIPEGVTVIKADCKEKPAGKWGDKLYVVMAIQFATTDGEEAHSGIGWAYDKNNPEHGLFVEHEGTSLAFVEKSIKSSLNNLFETRGLEIGEINSKTSSIVCKGKPVCAFTVAMFEDQAWDKVDK